MAMDITGYAPSSERGEYIRFTIWDWAPVARYIVTEGPQEIVSRCDKWFTNDHDGLDGESSRRLGEWLRERIADGSAAQFFRTTAIEPTPGAAAMTALQGMPGLEPVEPVSEGTALECLEAFAGFLEDCGGFSIG
jgi:hypothetical protein